jgi:hypothetical protein
MTSVARASAVRARGIRIRRRAIGNFVIFGGDCGVDEDSDFLIAGIAGIRKGDVSKIRSHVIY